MNFEPQTYEELIRMKRCVELTKYYEVTEEELWEIYVPPHRTEYRKNPEGDHGELHRQEH